MSAGHKILVVDDTAEILDLLTLVLSDEGFEVVCCQDARQALVMVAAERPALVILDLKMDGVDNWELVEALAAASETERMPFIVCSGAVQELQAAKARMRALGGDVLEKPFDLDLLVTKIRDLIGDAGEV